MVVEEKLVLTGSTKGVDMDKEIYQELVEHAYSNKALPIEAFDADANDDTISSILENGGFWSSGDHESTKHVLAEDYGARISSGRLAKAWSEQKLAEMLGVTKGEGDNQKKFIKNFESGDAKPNEEQVRQIERILGIELMIDPTLNGIQEGTVDSERQLKEHQVLSDYSALVAEIRPQIQDILLDAVANNPYREALLTWREMETFARVIPCCLHAETQQRVYVRYHPTDYNNHELQYRKFTVLMNEIGKMYDAPMADLKATFARRKPSENQKDGKAESPEDRLRRFEVNWRAVRDLVRGLNHNIAPGSAQPQPDEVDQLSSSHPLLAEFIMRLQILQKKVLHCPHCYEEYWRSSTWPVIADDADVEEKREHYWVAMADKITRSVIETCVANAAVRSPRTVVFSDENGATKNVRIGNEGSSDYERALLKEAVLTGYAFSDELSVAVGNAESGIRWIAFRDKQGDYSVNTALATAVLQRLSHELRSFYPELASHKNGESREDWCNTRAGQLLYAVQHAGIMFTIDRVHKQRIAYADGSTPKHHTNMIRLTEAIDERIRTLFTDENGRNWLQDLFGRERLPPMVTPPLARPIDAPGIGGYLTTAMQSKKPLISDRDGWQHLKRARFTPSNEAIEAINSLQRTKWRVDRYDVEGGQLAPSTYDVVQEVLKHEIKEKILERLVIQKGKDGHELVFTEFDQNVSRIRNGQVREWSDTLRFIDRLHEEFAGDPSFWHAWQFDWRGRMNPTTPMLSPQNDDVCRGLLRFAESAPLSEEGVLWLGRFTASLFRGRSSTVEGLSQGEAYSALLAELEDRTWSSFDSVANNPLFLSMIEEILSLRVLEGFKIWGEGDVFRKKAEGFQRYSAMKEFHRVMKEGGVGATSNLPVHLDASSSIYQHASALLRDKAMGQKVNVVAREDGMPADVYVHVSTALANIWENQGFLEDLNLSQVTKDIIKREVLHRSVAKGPVMTKGYGTGHRSMTKSLLTRNGDPDGQMGIEADEGSEPDDETDEPPVDTENPGDGIEETDPIDVGSNKPLWVAHEESTLGFLHGLDDVSPSQHAPIASAVISGYVEAIKVVLPSFDKVLKLLKGLVEINYIEPRLDAHLEHDAITDLLSQHLDVVPKKGNKWPEWSLNTTVAENSPTKEAIDELLSPLGWSVNIVQQKNKNQSLKLRPRTERYNAVRGPLTWSLPDGDDGGGNTSSNPAMVTLLNREREEGRPPKAPEIFTGASRIENWKWYDNTKKVVIPWKGARAHRTVARASLQRVTQHETVDLDAAIPTALTQPVDAETLEGAFPEGTAGHQAVRTLLQIEKERIGHVIQNLTSQSLVACFSEQTGKVDWFRLHEALGLPPSEGLIEHGALKKLGKTNEDARTLADFFFPFERRISHQVIVHNRAVRREKTAVAPNFIHSLDALHMRRFVRDMHRARHRDLWAVHDSFGCHANHVGEMRAILRKQFSVIHGLNSESGNVLLETAKRALNNVPWDKLNALSARWAAAPPETPAWRSGTQSGADPLTITKKVMGVEDIENILSLMGDMTSEDNNSSYFVN